MIQRALRRVPLLMIVEIASFCILLPVLISPLNSDNLIYHAMAKGLVMDGRIPYFGTWAHNLPGVVYFQAIAFMLFGSADFALRAVDIGVQLIFVAFLFRSIAKVATTRIATIASLLYVSYYVSAGPSMYTEYDVYCSMLFLVLVFVLFENVRSTPRIIIAGVLVGLTVTMRPTNLLYVPIVASYIIYEHRRISSTSVFRTAGFILASLLPLSVILLYYYTIPSGLISMFETVVLFNANVYSKLEPCGLFWWELGRNGGIIAFALFAILSRSLPLKVNDVFSNASKALYAVITFISLAIVVLMAKYIRYQYAPFFIFLIPLAAAGVDSFANLFRVRQTAIVALACFACTFIAFNPKEPVAFLSALIQGKPPIREVRQAANPSKLFGETIEQSVLSYIDSDRDPTAAVCSFDPSLTFHLRSPVGKYATLTALALHPRNAPDSRPQYTDYQLRWQREYVDSLCMVKAHFIVLARHMPFWHTRDVYDDCLHYLPGFDSLLTSSYRYDTTFGGYQLYRRIDTR
jgi:hypothetical protein